MARFPMFSNFKIVPLPSHLSPSVIHPDKAAVNIFIYSPFQNVEVSKDTYWVANCGCEVSVQVVNLLPMELTVKNLTLLSEGCAFESVPVRLNLPPCGDDPEPALIKLLGFPRSPGRLTITGYSCEVLGVKNICAIKEQPKKQAKSNKSSSPGNGQNNNSSAFTVEVLRALPLLQLETSLQRAPTTEENVDPIAEATVFSGQMFSHSVVLHNTSEDIVIKNVKFEIFQPKVNGGPALVQLLDSSITEPTTSHPLEFSNLAPKERREIRFQIFGIDPSNTAGETFEETKIRVPLISSQQNEAGTPETPIGHDLIPYTGRILRADFVFRYIADVKGPNREEYERTAKLSLAISIVPALTVSNWHVLPGDDPSTRYVVVDVTNQTETDAELTYSLDKMISVQSKDVCRVPLLCPCCSEVPLSAFHLAAQRASHMMQMQEMERLRRTLEKHVSKHLDIRWTIPKLKLEGYVPVGSLLSSVSLLKQLVVPVISV
uniref:Trs120/TRAPPC9 first Ig-like domain-containing protein n=1 Tax=Acrobeloides nanus TaxID=290746 RepID=A0A914EJM1_9BILA